jgi:uncharacterized protein YdhG (YjbR/CyaY superfamily)
VSNADPKRESVSPAIEKRYGKPMSHWHKVVEKVSKLKYADQMSHLMETHGFTGSHASALVMYSRGSTTTRRYDSPEAYFATLDGTKSKTMRKIFTTLHKAYPDLELVIAWNQPMLKQGTKYVFGASAGANHILLATWNPDTLIALADRLTLYEVNKKTIRVPIDWKVDAKLLRDLVAAQMGS